MCWSFRPVVNHSLSPPAAISHNKGEHSPGRKTHIYLLCYCLICNTEVCVCAGRGHSEGAGGRIFFCFVKIKSKFRKKLCQYAEMSNACDDNGFILFTHICFSFQNWSKKIENWIKFSNKCWIFYKVFILFIFYIYFFLNLIKWLWDILLEQYLCIVVPFSSFRLFFSSFLYIY